MNTTRTISERRLDSQGFLRTKSDAPIKVVRIAKYYQPFEKHRRLSDEQDSHSTRWALGEEVPFETWIKFLVKQRKVALSPVLRFDPLYGSSLPSGRSRARFSLTGVSACGSSTIWSTQLTTQLSPFVRHGPRFGDGVFLSRARNCFLVFRRSMDSCITRLGSTPVVGRRLNEELLSGCEGSSPETGAIEKP